MQEIATKGRSEKKPARGIKSIENAYGILTAIQEGPAPVPLKLIAERSAMPASAVHVYLTSMVRTGMVQPAGRGLYTLGPALAALGMTAVRQVDGFEAVRTRAHALSEETGVGVAVVTWSETGPVILYNFAGRMKSAVELRNGPVSILWTGSGNVFIATLPRATTRAVALKEAAAGGMSAKQCDRFLDGISERFARRSFAVQEVRQLPGFMAVSAPIWDANGQVAYALTLTAPKALLNTDPDGPHVDVLLRSARAASQALPTPTTG